MFHPMPRPHTAVHHVVRREDDSHGKLVDGRTESSRGSPGLRTGYQVDIGEEEAMLETIDPAWRTTRWLQLAVQGILDDKMPWYEFIIPLTVGTEGMALSLAKCLLVVWQWSIKVQGRDVCLPTLTALNIGQFMTREEVLEGVDDPLWFAAYSSTLHAFWEETGVELAAACIKLCWELPPRSVFRRREGGLVAYAITFVDKLAMQVPSLDAWDQFVWPPDVAMPWAIMEAEQYSYCHGQAVDLGPVMLVTQVRVTDEAGTYFCAVWTLVFEGSILAYNPTRDEAEWVPVHSLANNLSWAEEKSTVALANYVPHISQEGARIVRLRAHHLVSWPDDSSSMEEEEEEEQEEDEDHEKGEEREEVGPKPLSTDVELKQGEAEEEPKPSRRRQSWDWGSTMKEEERLAFDDLQSDSNATADGRLPRHSTPYEPGSPREMAVEVHARESEVEEL